LLNSFKLVPRPLNECPRPKSGKLRLNLEAPVLEGKSIVLDPKKSSAKRRVLDLENQESG
jgi:hypothetical protein